MYDVDCVTWSPQGKLFQVEYAKEAVKHGGLTLGLRSKTHAVILSEPGSLYNQEKPDCTGHLPRQDIQGRQHSGHVHFWADFRCA